jgi:hypothetical protein
LDDKTKNPIGPLFLFENQQQTENINEHENYFGKVNYFQVMGNCVSEYSMPDNMKF